MFNFYFYFILVKLVISDRDITKYIEEDPLRFKGTTMLSFKKLSLQSSKIVIAFQFLEQLGIWLLGRH